MKKSVIQLLVVLSALGVSGSSLAAELLKLVTSEPGLHRISYEQLASSGADLSGLRHNRFGLSVNGEWVQLSTVGQKPGRKRFFGPGGYLEFYAEPADDLYSDEQVYVLHLLNNDELSNRKRFGRSRTKLNPQAVSVERYTHTTLVEENNTYDFSSPSESDPFHFGQTISYPPHLFGQNEYGFELVDVLGGSAQAEVEVEMYGLLDFDIEGNDHHYEIEVNGLLLGDQQFDGVSATRLTLEGVVINSGSNTLKYNYRSIANVPFDRIALNRFTVRYPRSTDAGGAGYLSGYFDAEQVRVTNFGGGGAKVYRRLESGRIVELQRGIQTGGGEVLFNTGGQFGEYIVASATGYPVPRVEALVDEQDITSGEAEYLIIAHASLLGSELDELVSLRSQEYSVKVVDVEQVYAQFGHHRFGAAGIQSYIRHAVAEMGTKMVVLLGNDTLDYKQYTSASVSLIPTRYVSTPGGALTITQTPSDVAYGDLDEDGVPELVVGRISARTKAELGNVVSKIQAYEAREGYVGRTVIATDKDDIGNGVSFSDDAEAMIAAIPSEWSDGVRPDFRAYPDVDGHQAAHDKLINLMNLGVSVVSYIGHSSQQSWGYTTPPMLRGSEIVGLTNVGRPSVVTQWGCWNTYFVDPRGNTMADMFLLSGENGAATVLGATTLTSSAGERALGVELNKRMYVEGKTIGEAMIEAKRALAEYEDYPAVQLGWHLLGDPALKVNH